MKQKQQKWVKKQCCYHTNKSCNMACFNQNCQSHLLCQSCLQENKHSEHNEDLKELDILNQYMHQISNDCGDFIASLQNVVNSVCQKMNELIIGIRQKYQLSEKMINQLNSNQISSAISEMFRFNEIKQQLNQKILNEINNLNQALELCLKELNLYSIIYLDTSNDKMNQSKILQDKGYQLYSKMKYEAAIGLLNQSLNLNPNNLQTLWCKGDSLIMLGQYQESLSSFDRILQIDPKHVPSLCSKAESLRSLSKQNESLILLDKALEIDPKHIKSLSLKGECLQNQEKYQEACIWYQKVLDIDPNDQFSVAGKKLCLQKIAK